MRRTESYRPARIPLPALRATFPPGEGMRPSGGGVALLPSYKKIEEGH